MSADALYSVFRQLKQRKICRNILNSITQSAYVGKERERETRERNRKLRREKGNQIGEDCKYGLLLYHRTHTKCLVDNGPPTGWMAEHKRSEN